MKTITGIGYFVGMVGVFLMAKEIGTVATIGIGLFILGLEVIRIISMEELTK